ncbi:MAG: YigZ family protein, partial [Halanaerobium sp.]|nr:YigZ family protein [Halanaerobium sp.]
IKEEFPDATHNVSAYKVGWGDGAIKLADDDGEPAGSSGPPVLQAIEGFGVTNTVVVVTRYFGGTKLGIGGLIRAYGQTASLGLEEAGKVEKRKRLTVSIKIDYQGLGAVINLIEGTQGEIIDTKYDNEGAAVHAYITPSFLNKLKKQVRGSTRGRGRVEVIAENFIG